ncbi:MAG: hypothetical protein M1821_003328 [Bathelium mastoideum]|nr:MAG: hypothetical protein M1821_003328 [Bathelium mastoideum]
MAVNLLDHVQLNTWIDDVNRQDVQNIRQEFLRGLGINELSQNHDGFFKALKQTLQPVFLDYDYDRNIPDANAEYMLREYIDIFQLYGIILGSRNMTRGQILQKVKTALANRPNPFPTQWQDGAVDDCQEPNQLSHDAIIQESIELVIWIWLMVDLQADPPLGRNTHHFARAPRPWRHNQTIEDAVLSSLSPLSTISGFFLGFPPTPFRLGDPRLVLAEKEDEHNDHDRQFSCLLNLREIERLTRIKVIATDNLLDHLSIQLDPDDELGNLVYIFDQSTWLRRVTDPTNQVSAFYEEAANEALETLAFLIPLDDREAIWFKRRASQPWYKRKFGDTRGPTGMWLSSDADKRMAPQRRVQLYRVWRHRLLMLEKAFASSSSTLPQLLIDQRDNNKRWQLWGTVLGFYLAVFLIGFTIWIAVVTQKLYNLESKDAKKMEESPPAVADTTTINNYYIAPGYSFTDNFTMPVTTSVSPPQSSATTVSRSIITIYPDTYSRYDVDTGSLEYDVQSGEIQKKSGLDSTTTFLNFVFPNETSGQTCQFNFWLGSDTTHTGSQEFDIFISDAQPFQNSDSWPSGNQRNNYAGRMTFRIVPGFAEFEAGFANVAQQFPCPGAQSVAYELVGVNDGDDILWNKTDSGPSISSRGD